MAGTWYRDHQSTFLHILFRLSLGVPCQTTQKQGGYWTRKQTGFEKTRRKGEPDTKWQTKLV